VKELPSKTWGSKSEDPATNLSLNIQDVVETVGAAARRGAASASEKSAVRSKYFDTSDRAAIEKLLRDAAVPADNFSARVDAAQATLHEAAKSHTNSAVSDTTGQANAGPAGFDTGPLTLEASTPNVLGTQSRTMLIKYSIGIAIVALLACMVTFFSGRDVSQLSLALVVLAFACMVIAYLTTMGFGSVELRYGSNDSSDQSK
jgi:hypothetical protein